GDRVAGGAEYRFQSLDGGADERAATGGEDLAPRARQRAAARRPRQAVSVRREAARAVGGESEGDSRLRGENNSGRGAGRDHSMGSEADRAGNDLKLERLYALRFSTAEREANEQLWRVLCDS